MSDEQEREPARDEGGAEPQAGQEGHREATDVPPRGAGGGTGGPGPTRASTDQTEGGAPTEVGQDRGGQPPRWGEGDRRPRRRGRRGRGGGGGQRGDGFRGGPQQLRPPYRPGGQPSRPGGPPFRPGGPPFRPGGQPFRPGAPPLRPGGPVREDDEGSSQASELAAYERRQRQQQQRGWRPPGQWRGGAQQRRYDDAIRRVTTVPHAAPSHDTGEPIAGPHAIIEALRAGRVLRRLYVSQDRNTRAGAVNELIAEAQQRRVQVRYVDRLEVARLSPIEDHQGVVAIAEGRHGVELDELLLHLDTLDRAPLVLLVDSLQDPQNFGVLLRSAEGAGVDGVVIPRHRAVGITPAVAKTSAGASEHLLVADVANLRQAIDALKEKGVWVIGTDDSGDLLYDEVDYRGASAIVVGGEGEGIRRLVLEGCDQVVRIPMLGKVSSLNAAAAGTLVLYEAVRQRTRDLAPPGTRTPRPVPAEMVQPDEDAEIPTAALTPTGVGESAALASAEETDVEGEIRGDDEDVAEFEAAEDAEAVAESDEGDAGDQRAAEVQAEAAANGEPAEEPAEAGSAPQRPPRGSVKKSASRSRGPLSPGTTRKTTRKRSEGS